MCDVCTLVWFASGAIVGTDSVYFRSYLFRFIKYRQYRGD